MRTQFNWHASAINWCAFKHNLRKESPNNEMHPYLGNWVVWSHIYISKRKLSYVIVFRLAPKSIEVALQLQRNPVTNIRRGGGGGNAVSLPNVSFLECEVSPRRWISRNLGAPKVILLQKHRFIPFRGVFKINYNILVIYTLAYFQIVFLRNIISTNSSLLFWNYEIPMTKYFCCKS